MKRIKGLALWHQFVASKDGQLLKDFLAKEVVFHSPVVWTPQQGKEIVKMYLIAAGQIIANDDFEYVKELSNANYTVLEFKTIIDGVSIEGVDILTFNEENKLVDLKVMIRPLKAVQIVHQKMGEFLLKMKEK